MFTLECEAKLGTHQLLREITRDGYGILYQAVSPSSQETRLLRALSPEISGNPNFLARFDLMRLVLPKIDSPHLIPIREMGREGDIFYIVYALAGADLDQTRSLSCFDASETPNRTRTLIGLFEGIASALLALESVKDHYYTQGITHDSLHPDNILISFESSLIGSSTTPVARVGGFAESFLFYGDAAHSHLRYRMALPAFAWKQYPEERQNIDLYREDAFYPPQLRRGEPPPTWLHAYSFGTLCYHYLTGRLPKGHFPLPTKIDASLDPEWDQITGACLDAPFAETPITMAEVKDRLQALLKRLQASSPEERRLQNIVAPEGMQLVILHEKAELGASDGPEVEQPRFRARIAPFFIDSAPVTVREFSRFMPSYKPSQFSRDADQPATMLSWHMAEAYCAWRSEQEGLPAGSYRLPTEYEWEAACRGSSGEQYPWGQEADARRVHCAQAPNTGSLTVRRLPPGRFGLYDLLGNVWEWTASRFKAHPFSKQQIPEYEQDLKVAKGGSWVSSLDSCRASARAAFPANERKATLGFRCVRLVESTEETE